MHMQARKLVTAVAVAVALLMAAPAAAFAGYGAVAVGFHGFGKSANFPTKHSAEVAAFNKCTHFTAGCKVIFWVGGFACGAAYKQGSTVYFAFGHSKRAAKRKVHNAHPFAHFVTATCGNHT
jgi:hypothetical protein